MTTTDTRRPVTFKALAVGLMTACVAFVGLVYRAETIVIVPSPGVFYAPAFRTETSGPGAVLNAHDGQAFGSLALDPLLSRPTNWGGGRPEMAYRAARPLLGWVVMLTSFGSATAVEWSLLVWTAIGIGVMVTAARLLADRWRRQGDWVPLLLFLPGVAGQVLFGGLSDGLAAGLALIGLLWWLDHRDRWAIAALCLAALGRETTLLVPLALLLATERRRALRLLIPFAVYAGWVGVVWLRLRALPIDAGKGRLALPPGNFVSAMGSWGWVQVMAAGSIMILGVVAWRRAPCREVRWLVVVSALFAAMLGPEVLRAWDLARPLLPVTIVGACLVARRTVAATSEQPSTPAASAVQADRPAPSVLGGESSAGRVSRRTNVS